MVPPQCDVSVVHYDAKPRYPLVDFGITKIHTDKFTFQTINKNFLMVKRESGKLQVSQGFIIMLKVSKLSHTLSF